MSLCAVQVVRAYQVTCAIVAVYGVSTEGWSAGLSDHNHPYVPLVVLPAMCRFSGTFSAVMPTTPARLAES